jgi:NADH dehydrogenase FAD-containing subunit
MTKFTTAGIPGSPSRIVISGNSNVSLGAYRQLEKKLEHALSKGSASITVITESPFHTCYGLLQECLAGEINYQNLLVPMTELYPKAEIIHGQVTSQDENAKLLTVELINGSELLVPYDQFLADEACFAKPVSNKAGPEFFIHTLEDITELRQKLTALVSNAASAKDRLSTSRHLRVAVAGNGLAGIELATSIASTIKQLCNDFAIPQLKPTVYLLLHNAELYEGAAFNRLLESYFKTKFFETGVRVSSGIQVTRVNADGAVCSDGSFINCSLVVRTDNLVNRDALIMEKRPDKYGRAGSAGCWKPVNYFPGSIPEPASYLAALKQGSRLGENIARQISGKNLVELKSSEGFRAGSLKKGEGFCRFGPLKLKGSAAYFVRTWLILRSLPAPLRILCIRNMTDTYFLRQQLQDLGKRLKVGKKQSFKLNAFSAV